MYTIYGDNICIYSDTAVNKNVKALSPKLTFADNTAGSLEITLPPDNAGYSVLKRLTSVITVYRDNTEIWEGRIISERCDFQNRRALTCEGELAYLNDTIQPPRKYEKYSVRDFLTALIEVHNAKVGEGKRFKVGSVTVYAKSDDGDVITAYTNYGTTLACINELLIKNFDGHIRVRKVNGERLIDYLADYPSTNTQTIRFGENLLDFVRNWDMTDLATVILPRGAKLDKSEIDGIESYLTIKDVSGGSIYVADNDAVEEYGRIERVVDWNDITDANELLKKALSYLKEEQFNEMVLELSAVDLHYLSKSAEPVKLLDNVRCISLPHGLDRLFPVTKLEIPIDDPGGVRYTLGGTVTQSFTSATGSANSDILNKLDVIPTKKGVLAAAKENASTIMNMATTGFVTIVKDLNDPNNPDEYHSEALIISDEKDYAKATRLWKWNMNGLGYSKDGGKTFPLAMTMDGAIVADFITTGTMSADRVRSGILEADNGNGHFNLRTGELAMKKGSIDLGGKFTVNNEGYLDAVSGMIGGFTITNDDISNSGIRLNKYGIEFRGDKYYSSSSHELIEIGNQGSQVWSVNGVVDNRYHGLTFDLNPEGSFISWESLPSSTASAYEAKLIYTSADLPTDDGGRLEKDTLHIFCNIDAHRYAANNFWIEPDTGGANGGTSYTGGKIYLPTSITSSGAVSAYVACRLKNGFLIK